MPSTLLKASVLLAFSLLANASPQRQTQIEGFAIGAVDDWVSSGNYLIYSCGSQAANVRNALDFTYLYLQTAMLSTNAPAYEAFFHTADPAPLITVLNAITAGTNITTRWHGSKRPTVICANADDIGIRSVWNHCKDPRDTTIVFQPPETALVFLCPTFFRLLQSPEASQCRLGNAGTQFSNNYIANTQYGILVNALADMYIRQTMPRKGTLTPGVRDMNACLALPPDQAFRNGASYSYFVSSMCHFFLDSSSRVNFF